MTKTCDHLICIVNDGACCLRLDPNSYGMGGPIGSKVVPPETIARAQALLDGLDRDAINAELARRKMMADIAALVALVHDEQRDCLRTQSTPHVKERAAQLLDKLSAIKTVDDLGRSL